ncbi:MAG: Na+/H+ antiporter subunit E [Verrucomicrobiota bacterium]
MKLVKLVRFFAFYLYEIFLSNFRVAYDVITPNHDMTPGFFAIPLDPISDRQLLVLANLITMTPGTLSLDVSTDRSTLYIHAMYVDDQEKFIREVRDLYMAKIKEVF